MIRWTLIQSAAVVVTAIAGYLASMLAGGLSGFVAALASGAAAVVLTSTKFVKDLLEVEKLRAEVEQLKRANREANAIVARPSSEEVRRFGIPAAERNYPLLDHYRRTERLQPTDYIASDRTLSPKESAPPAGAASRSGE